MDVVGCYEGLYMDPRRFDVINFINGSNQRLEWEREREEGSQPT